MCLLLGTVPNRLFASTTWTETQKSDWSDGLTSNTTWYPTTQLELDKPDWAPWMDNNWKYRRKINISNGGASGLSNYQVWIPTTSFTSSEWNDITSKAQSDMDDFRFTMSTAITTIPYWIEPDTDTPEGFWVKVTTVPTSGTSIFMYYGNSVASVGSNMSDTGMLYDDFLGSSFNTNIWNADSGTWGVGSFDGKTCINIEPAVNDEYLRAKNTSFTNSSNWLIETLMYSTQAGDASCHPAVMFYAASGFNDHVYFRPHSYNEVENIQPAYYDGTLHTAPPDPFLGSYNWTTWHKIKLILKGNAVDVYIDDSLKGTQNGLQYDGTYQNVGIGAHAGGKSYWDYIRVRKYAATEPTIDSVGAEEGKYYSEGNYKANVVNSGADGTKVHQVDWNPSSQAAGTDVNIYARASNTSFAAGDGTPSWTSVSNGGNPAVVGRYIQWMSTFTTTSSTTTPRLEDITLTYTSPSPAPVVNYNAGDSYTQITWKWADNSSGQYQEEGFKIYSSTGGVMKTLSADTTNWIETGLERNTQYSRYVQAYNVAGSSNSATVSKKTQPCVWQDKTTVRTGPNAFGFDGDGVWTWEVPATGGSLLTITAYVRYNSDYGGASKPKITLYNNGVNDDASMTGGADTWEKLTVSGTPTGKGVLFLKAEGFSTAVDAKYFVDDIQISQP